MVRNFNLLLNLGQVSEYSRYTVRCLLLAGYFFLYGVLILRAPLQNNNDNKKPLLTL